MFQVLIIVSAVITLTRGYDLIIIGAGISGFGAGTYLMNHGFNNFIILEAENRTGGRINTIPFGANVIDLGAQWCEGKFQAVYNLSAPLGLLEDSKFDLDDIEFVDDKGTPYPVSLTHKIRNTLNEISEEPEADEYDGSLGDYVDKRFREEVKSLGNDKKLAYSIKRWFFKSRLEEEGATSMYDISSRLTIGFKIYPGSQFQTWKDKGYRTIFEVLMNQMEPKSNKGLFEEKIFLNKEVNNIFWNHDGVDVVVQCEDGSVYKAKRVLITTSLGVLKDRINTMFTPSLPKQNLNAIKTLGMGTVNKIFIEFQSNWWAPVSPNGFNFLWTNDKCLKSKIKYCRESDWWSNIIGFRSVDFQPNVLLGWIVTESAAKMETIPEEVVRDKVVELLRKYLGVRFNITQPVNFQRSSWYSNPHFRGTYSYPSMLAGRFNATAADLASTVRNNQNEEVLYFGGEATHSYSFATVHGALESGWREAEKILNNFNKK